MAPWSSPAARSARIAPPTTAAASQTLATLPRIYSSWTARCSTTPPRRAAASGPTRPPPCWRSAAGFSATTPRWAAASLTWTRPATCTSSTAFLSVTAPPSTAAASPTAARPGSRPALCSSTRRLPAAASPTASPESCRSAPASSSATRQTTSRTRARSSTWAAIAASSQATWRPLKGRGREAGPTPAPSRGLRGKRPPRRRRRGGGSPRPLLLPDVPDQPQLPLYRPRHTPQPPRDLPQAVALHLQERHLLQSRVAQQPEQPPPGLGRRRGELRGRLGAGQPGQGGAAVRIG